MKKQLNLIWGLMLIWLMIGCKKELILSSEKQLITFSFADMPQAQITLDQTAKSIKVTFPRLTDVKALKPTITVSPAAMVSPASGVAQDFSKPVVYTVTAEDGSTQAYTVSGSVTKLTDKQITGFKLGGVDATIDQTAKTIKAELPAGTDLTKLTPTITVSTGATVAPASGAVQDFSKDVAYTVTAEDGTTQAYTVSLTVIGPIGGTVFIGSSTGYFYAFDALTGTKKWEYRNGYSIYASSTVTENQMVYVGDARNKLYAINAITGEKKWEFTGDFTSVLWSVPVVKNGILYIGSGKGDKKLYAFDALSGVKKWEFQVSGEISSNPTVVDGVVYFCGGADKNIYALDANTGSKKWSFSVDSEILESPLVTNNVLYVQSGFNSSFYFIDITNGKLISKTQIKIPISSSSYRPVIYNGIVYGTTGSLLYGLDIKTGQKIWETSTYGLGSSNPLINNNILYFSNDVGILYALDLKTNKIKWEFKSSKGIVSNPSIANGIVYFGSRDGKLYAIDTDTGQKKWESVNINVEYSSPCILDKNNKVYLSSSSGGYNQ